MFAILAALIGATASGCLGVTGADRLWQPEHRWVIVGELHGTNEIPDAFSNLVCLASATGRPVTVALEYSADSQNVIDTYLTSNGGIRAKSALLSLPMWHSEMQDGRGSVAFVRLWNNLRKMKQAGSIRGVVATDIGRSTPAGSDRDASMAKAWMAISTAANGLIVALVGNIHAMRKPLARPNRTIITAASLLPTKQTVTVNVLGSGGMAWNCQQDGCSAHANGSPSRAVARIEYSTDVGDQWDSFYKLGIPTTASNPAITSSAATVNKR